MRNEPFSSVNEIERGISVKADADAPVNVTRSSPRTKLWIVLALAVPLGAAATYFLAGWPGLASAPAPASPPASGQEMDLGKLAARLSARLEREGGNADDWGLLGRAQRRTGRYVLAIESFRKALAMRPNDADALADLADALVMENGKRWTPEASETVRAALDLNAAQPKALWLAASELMDRGDFKAALGYWNRLAPVAGSDGELSQAAAVGIREATERLGGKPPPGTPPVQSGAAAVGSATAIKGTVKVAPELAKQVSPGDVVFVLARATAGGGPPLAALRIPAAQLPASFALDDSNSMMPNRKLSTAEQVVIAARLSHSGNPVAQAGDLEGTSATVKPGADAVNIVIDHRVN